LKNEQNSRSIIVMCFRVLYGDSVIVGLHLHRAICIWRDDKTVAISCRTAALTSSGQHANEVPIVSSYCMC